MIKAVLFDYGGVLVSAGRAGSNRVRLAAMLETEPEEVETIFQPEGPYYKLNRGLIDNETFWSEVELFTGFPTAEAKRLHYWEWAQLLRLEPALLVAARELREKGLVTGILSNVVTPVAEFLHREERYLGFNPVILSSEVGLAKPEPRIYELALERLNLFGNQVLLIDDQEANLEPARRLGMETILATDPGQIIDELAGLMEIATEPGGPR